MGVFVRCQRARWCAGGRRAAARRWRRTAARSWTAQVDGEVLPVYSLKGKRACWCVITFIFLLPEHRSRCLWMNPCAPKRRPDHRVGVVIPAHAQDVIGRALRRCGRLDDELLVAHDLAAPAVDVRGRLLDRLGQVPAVAHKKALPHSAINSSLPYQVPQSEAASDRAHGLAACGVRWNAPAHGRTSRRGWQHLRSRLRSASAPCRWRVGSRPAARRFDRGWEDVALEDGVGRIERLDGRAFILRLFRGRGVRGFRGIDAAICSRLNTLYFLSIGTNFLPSLPFLGSSTSSFLKKTNRRGFSPLRTLPPHSLACREGQPIGGSVALTHGGGGEQEHVDAAVWTCLMRGWPGTPGRHSRGRG